ncbi:MAG: DUF5752 family protein [Candidatus Bathyarchaeota archaeon]|nr:DUF5752 family protein [Candidatus Bathyarchaeota archaeon]
MSLSPIKQEILETMLLSDKPQKAAEIAKNANREFQPVMMHLLGLTRMGYVSCPEKGLYAITDKGKTVIGIPETTKEKAADILAYAPHDKAFEFYIAVGKPLGIHAHSLRDFAHKLNRADVASIDFHMKRGDFEAWFKGLGDEELAKKTALLKRKYTTAEELQTQLAHITEQRYFELAELTGQVLPEEHNHNH